MVWAAYYPVNISVAFFSSAPPPGTAPAQDPGFLVQYTLLPQGSPSGTTTRGANYFVFWNGTTNGTSQSPAQGLYSEVRPPSAPFPILALLPLASRMPLEHPCGTAWHSLSLEMRLERPFVTQWLQAPHSDLPQAPLTCGAEAPHVYSLQANHTSWVRAPDTHWAQAPCTH